MFTIPVGLMTPQASDDEFFLIRTNLQSGTNFDPNCTVTSGTITWHLGNGDTEVGNNITYEYTDGLPSHDVTITSVAYADILTFDVLEDGITEITYSALTGCTTMVLRKNPLPIIDLTDLTAMQVLNARFDNNHSSLILSGATGMEDIDIRDNDIGNTDYSDCTLLDSLIISNCDVTDLDITGLTLLDNLIFNNNTISDTNLAEIIVELEANGVTNGTLNYSGVPNVSCLTEWNQLVTDGWTITGSTPA